MGGFVGMSSVAKALTFWILILCNVYRAHGETESGEPHVKIVREKIPLTDDNIHSAVDEWTSDRESAKVKYGHIKNWDTSGVTNMLRLFQGKKHFNWDISHWNTSSVTNMAYLFNGAAVFNHNLHWDTSKVIRMDGIFNFASSFNGDISGWSTESVWGLDYAFSHATSFNADISSWDTSKVKYMAFTFWNATSFSHDLSKWSIANVDDMEGMFYNASGFNQTLCWKDLKEIVHVQKLFCGSPGTLDPACVDSELLALVDEYCPKKKDTVDLPQATDAATDAPPGSKDNSTHAAASDTPVGASVPLATEPPTSEQTPVANTTTDHPAPSTNLQPIHPLPNGPEVQVHIINNMPTPTNAPVTEPYYYDDDATSAALRSSHQSTYHSSTILMYLAMAFVSLSLVLVIFMCCFVLYKRRQIMLMHARAEDEVDTIQVYDDECEDDEDLPGFLGDGKYMI